MWSMCCACSLPKALILIELCDSALTGHESIHTLGARVDFNHTKPLMRLLRNRGMLAAMLPEKKLELALWLLNCSQGDLARKTHYLGRADMHKLVKEAFVCLAESCTKRELDEVGSLKFEQELHDRWNNAPYVTFTCRSLRSGGGVLPSNEACEAGYSFRDTAMKGGWRMPVPTMSAVRINLRIRTQG